LSLEWTRRRGYVRVFNGLSRTLGDYPYAPPPAPYSYLVFEKAGMVYARNGKTGELEFSDEDAAKVIQSALGALTSGRTWKEKVVSKGDFEISDTIKLPSYTILEIQGRLRAKDALNKPILQNSDIEAGNRDVVVIGGELDGNKTTQTAEPVRVIHFQRVTNGRIHGVHISNAKDRAIEVDFGSGVIVSNCYIEDTGVASGDHGIMIWSPTAETGIYRGHLVKDCVIRNSYGNNVDVGTVRGVIISGILSFNAVARGINIDTGRDILVSDFFDKGSATALGIVSAYADSLRIVFDNCWGVENSGNAVKMQTLGYKIEAVELNHVIGMAPDDFGIHIYADNGQISKILLNSCLVRDAGKAGALRSGLLLQADSGETMYDVKVHNSIFYDVAGYQNYGFETLNYGTMDRVTMIGGSLRDNAVGAYRDRGTVAPPNFVMRDVDGYVTVNSGTATIAAGTTSATAAHGLAATPTKVLVTPRADIGDVWVSARDAANITISCDAAPVTEVIVDWYAEV